MSAASRRFRWSDLRNVNLLNNTDMIIRKSPFRVLGMAALGLLVASSVASCSGGDKGQALQAAAAVADSIVSADGNANVEVNEAGTGLDATFRMTDSLINVDAIGKELFDAYAAQQLKTVAPDDINTISHALTATKGDIKVQILGTDQKSKEFTLSPREFVNLQKARLSQLDPGQAKEQVVKVAEGMCPNPKAHEKASKVEVAVVKSFLEYNIVFPSQKDFADLNQGMLTFHYLNALKTELKNLGEMEQPVVDLLLSLGIDGVRIQYSAEDSEKVLKQAFPWREMQKPLEDYTAGMK